MGNKAANSELMPVVILSAALVFGAGTLRSESQPECTNEANMLGQALCGLEIGGNEQVEAAAPTTTQAPQLQPVTLPPTLDALQTVETSPPSASTDYDPFDISWHTDPVTGHNLMVIDGKYPINYQHDPQWSWPEKSVYGGGCMCGDSVYASGIEYLTGQFISPVDVYNRLEDAGGHQDDACGGMPSDRPLVAELYGLTPHTFGSIYEAEQFATTIDPNVFVIIGQDYTDGDSFSPYGSHIIGLIFDTEYGAWRATDPNDFHKDDAMLTLEPEMADNQRFWTSDQINNGIYSVHGITNPNGRQPGPWEL